MAFTQTEDRVFGGGTEGFIQVEAEGPEVVGEDVGVDVTVRIRAVGTFEGVTDAEIYRVGAFGAVEFDTFLSLNPGESQTEQVIFDGDIQRDEYSIAVRYSGPDDRFEPNVTNELRLSLPASELPSESNVGLPRDAVVDLALPNLPDTVTVGQNISLAVEATLKNGGTEIGVANDEFSSSNEDVAFVTDAGSFQPQSPGSTRVTVSLETDRRTITASKVVDVQPEPADIAQPGQPEAETLFRFPFSIFNAVPGIDEARDFLVRIPQTKQIGQAVESQVLDPRAIRTAVGTALDDLSIPQPPSVSDIVTEIETTLSIQEIVSTDDTTTLLPQNIVDLPETLGLPDLPDGEDVGSLLDSAESGVSDLSETVDTTVDSTIDTADNAFESVQGNLQDSFDTATETISGEIDTAVTTLDEIQGNVDGFGGVTLPDIDSTIDGLLEDAETVDSAIDSRVNDVEQSLGLTEDSPSTASQLGLPTLSDITEAVIDEIEAQIIPEADDVLLTDDVPLFLTITIEDFLQQSLSAETQQNLDDVAQRVSQDVQ
jgi:hypothetical protein